MDFSVKIHQHGKYRGLPIYEESLLSLKPGSRTSLVAQIVMLDFEGTGGHLCKTLINSQFFRLKHDMPEGTTKVTVLNGLVHHYRSPIIQVDNETAVLCHPERHATDILKLVETCGGLGALGQGAAYAGWKTVVLNELQETFCNHMKQYQQVPVVQGDIKDMRTIRDIHNIDPSAGTMAWGFSCQPFSQLGDQKQGQDQRAMTLPFGLVAAYLLQKEVVILECVPNAATSTFVQLCISQFLMHTQFEKAETLLELGDCWPSKRRRWWSVITKGVFGKVQLQGLPQLTEKPTIGNVLPYFYRPNDEELGQLTLTEHEMNKFAQFGKGAKSQVIQMHNQLGTALHSWGNQVQECACKCRKGFSDARLIENGLHGALVVVDESVDHYRHIAPKEMAILCGFPKTTGWEDSQRLLMAGVGQLASPIQAAWVFAQVSNHFHDLRMCGLAFVKPRQILACVCADLFRLRDQWFPDEQPPASITMFREMIEELLEPTNLPIDNNRKDPEEQNKQELHCNIEAAIPATNSSIDTSMDSIQEQQEVGPFSQDAELLQVVKEAEQNKDRAKEEVESQIVNESTGGLMAFSSKRARVEKKQKEDKIEVQVPQVETPKAVVVHQVEEQCKVKIWYPHDERYAEITCFQSSKVEDLINAEKMIQNTEFLEAFSAIGRPLEKTELLKDYELIIIMEGTPVNSSLSKHAEGLGHWRRAEAALLQQGATALDEMQFYLRTLQANIQVSVAVVDPLWFPSMTEMPDSASEWIMQIEQQVGITMSAILLEEHWIPIIVGKTEEGKLSIFTTPEGKNIWPVMFPTNWDQFQIDVGTPLQSKFQWDCGFQTLTWIAFGVQLQKYEPMSPMAAHSWRVLFWQHAQIQNNPQIPLMLGGHQNELEVAIQALLKEHGVFAERLMERTKQMIDSLGTANLVAAIRSQRPWASIKQSANQCNPKFRLVQEDEFQKIIKSKASQNRAVGTKKNSREMTKVNHQYLLPADVTVPTGVFTQQNGEAVPHIDIQQVSPNAKGIVIVTESEYQPYAEKKQLSQEGLAFLIVAPYNEDLATAGEEIRFPAQSLATSEPVLMSAVMIQKGQQVVQRHLPKHQVQVAQIPTQTVKFLVYKDQYPNAWQDLVDRPVKQILELLPEMRICKSENCRCKAWHPADHQGEEPILDVWQRDFLSIHFKKSKPADAAIFTCMMRLTKECFDMVAKQSGTDGLFCEARSQDGKRQDESFHTVWLSKHTVEEARVAKVTSEVPASIIRVSNRYGLRVNKDDAKATHDAFRPDTPFLAGAAKSTWIIGPVPYGTTRKSLIKLFEAWQWQAKPLQPAGKAADGTGLKWHVQASEAPENFVYTLSHGDVLIVKENPEVVRPATMHRVEASEHTMKRASGQQPLHWDPWLEAAQQLQSSAPKNSQLSSAQIATLENNIEAKLIQKFRPSDADASMEPSVEPRVAKLEQQIQQLQVQQSENANATKQLSGKVDQFAAQMDGHSKQIQGHLDHKLAEQMDRIEALLAKRQRQE